MEIIVEQVSQMYHPLSSLILTYLLVAQVGNIHWLLEHEEDKGPCEDVLGAVVKGLCGCLGL